MDRLRWCWCGCGARQGDHLISAIDKNLHAVALGKLGGQATSPAKTAAVRANAKRPRPNARGKKKPRKPKAGDAVLERDRQKAGIA